MEDGIGMVWAGGSQYFDETTGKTGSPVSTDRPRFPDRLKTMDDFLNDFGGIFTGGLRKYTEGAIDKEFQDTSTTERAPDYRSTADGTLYRQSDQASRAPTSVGGMPSWAVPAMWGVGALVAVVVVAKLLKG